MTSTALFAARKRHNGFALVLCALAAGFGLGALALILWTLLRHGLGGLSPALITQMTPPPGEAGGLLNAIVGSLLLTALGVAIGAPLGILAGTYLAEYGRGSRLAGLVRFINDILLSAPSIVIGLFVYTIMVAPRLRLTMHVPPALQSILGQQFPIALGGHFSGLAGAVALALIVIPIVVRTTEDMLLLVPQELREAASALGAPRVLVIGRVAYKAAMTGIVTGILLAIARVSGETAPLLFTALNNQFWSVKLNAPMASLPVVIFQFAMSPYDDWQQLAWAGALLITISVLALSIAARVLSQRRRVR